MTETPLVAIATYNEIDNLPRLVCQIVQQMPQAHILVVDDNSPDGTGDWCQDHAQREPRFHCVVRAGKLGLGTAHLDAMRYAIDRQYGWIITMDADFSHDPAHLPQLWDGRRGLDVVIGSRYVAGGSIHGWPVYRHAMSRLVNLSSHWLMRLPCRDCSGAYRAYRTKTLERVDFGQVTARGYAFFEEFLWLLRRADARIGEVPIRFQERQLGNSKIDRAEAIIAAKLILRLGMREWFGL